MWQPQLERYRYAGVEFDGEQTAEVAAQGVVQHEHAYSNDYTLELTGAKPRPINVSAVFVGSDSLSRANALLSTIEAEPRGGLEHPWLGAIEVVTERASLRINNDLGLVRVEISFIRTAVAPPVSVNRKAVAAAANSAAIAASKAKLVADAEIASPSALQQLRSGMAAATAEIKKITNLINAPAAIAASIYRDAAALDRALNDLIAAPGNTAALIGDYFSGIVGLLEQSRSDLDRGDASDSSHQSAASEQSLRLATIAEPNAVAYGVSTGSAIEQQFVHAQTALAISQAQLETPYAPTAAAEQGSTATNTHAAFAALASQQPELRAELDSVRIELVRYYRSIWVAPQAELSHYQHSESPLALIAWKIKADEASIRRLNSIPHPLFASGTISYVA